MNESQVNALAQKVWDYHLMHQDLRKADAIFVLGSNDVRVAEHAVGLFKQGYAPYLIFSGNSGVLTKDRFLKPEAEVFADIAKEMGVPDEKILLESNSTNTGENILFTKKLLEEKGLHVKSLILVQKPYMERRTYATFMKQWPGMDFIVSSPTISFESYPTEQLPKDLVINIMLGDLQRIKFYPAKAFQIPQEIPDDVWQAYENLVKMGYDKHLIKES
jgi:uncharacterized SAM-binding protein YcdF (DUF218 family)